MVLSGWLSSVFQIPEDLGFSSLLPIPYTSSCMCLFNAVHRHGNKGQLLWLKNPIRLEPLSCMFTFPYQPISQSQHGSDVNRVTDMVGLNQGIPPAGNTEWAQKSIVGTKLPQQHFRVKASKKFCFQKLPGSSLWKAGEVLYSLLFWEREDHAHLWPKCRRTGGVTEQISPAEAPGLCGATDGLRRVSRHAPA